MDQNSIISIAEKDEVPYFVEGGSNMNSQPICYIFGAGEYHAPSSIQPSSDDLVIAADGGYVFAKQCKITVDLVLGDFDSLPALPPEDTETVVLPPEKDDTDMVAALREGWLRGFRTFHIYGGTGGRLDHTLANIQCIAALACHGGRGYLYDRDVIITAICNDSIAFPASSKGTISVFCHSETATGVFETGLKFPLANATLSNTYPLGISNEFTGVPSSISVQNGTLVILYPKNIQEVKK